MRSLTRRIPFFLLPLLSVPNAFAHCPLCTAGAIVAAGGAAYFGVNQFAIGVFIGAFAVSMGWWMDRLLKRRYVPGQRAWLILTSFLLTVLPLLAVLTEIVPFSIFLVGEYGSLLNRTYVLNLSLLGAILGGALVWVAPSLSARMTRWRGKQFPYQGITITFALLFLVAAIAQVLL